MVVNAAVFHFDISALNTEAAANTAGKCRCRVVVAQKKGKSENVKIKAMGVSGENSSERSKEQQNKEAEWTRTSIHARHRRSAPLGNVRVECRSTIEHCSGMSVPCVFNTIQIKGKRENIKIKAMGVSGENSSEGSKGQQ